MTPDRFRECLAALDWSQRGLAAYLDLHHTTVRRYATGEQAIPPHVAAWLERLARYHRAHPFPDAWERAGRPRASAG